MRSLVKSITIHGLRGFATEQELEIAQPNGKLGSGLTILIGPNNGGKSTVVESLGAFAGNRTTFSTGKRNIMADGRVSVCVTFANGSKQSLQTVETGGSETKRDPAGSAPENWYVLPSRRFFNPYFGHGQQLRRAYLANREMPNTRSTSSNHFSSRLFTAREKKATFEPILRRIMRSDLDWTIDQSDQGNYFLDVADRGHRHNSDGLGEGIVSLLFLVDAVYDSSKGDLIAIDEPELSLHPAYQRRVLGLLAEYAEDRQVVVATHSPHFIDFRHVMNGAKVARVHKRESSTEIAQLSEGTTNALGGLLRDLNNPHILGLGAREVFFQEDGVIVVEGQEDVVFYPLVLDELVTKGYLTQGFATDLKERFFGWGAGGADKIGTLLSLLNDLGFRQVAAIVDNDKKAIVGTLQGRFPDYEVVSIPANDVRTKKAQRARSRTHGLLDGDLNLRSEFLDEMGRLFTRIAMTMEAKAPENDSKQKTEE